MYQWLAPNHSARPSLGVCKSFLLDKMTFRSSDSPFAIYYFPIFSFLRGLASVFALSKVDEIEMKSGTSSGTRWNKMERGGQWWTHFSTSFACLFLCSWLVKKGYWGAFNSECTKHHMQVRHELTTHLHLHLRFQFFLADKRLPLCYADWKVMIRASISHAKKAEVKNERTLSQRKVREKEMNLATWLWRSTDWWMDGCNDIWAQEIKRQCEKIGAKKYDISERQTCYVLVFATRSDVQLRK